MSRRGRMHKASDRGGEEMNSHDRFEAVKALRAYPRIQRRQKEARITPDYGGVVVQHGASRTTENIALSSNLTDVEQNIVSAVDFALSMQGRCYNAEQRLKMVQMVYFQRTHTLQGAAMVVGYNVNTIKSWNSELLSAVFTALRTKEKK